LILLLHIEKCGVGGVVIKMMIHLNSTGFLESGKSTRKIDWRFSLSLIASTLRQRTFDRTKGIVKFFANYLRDRTKNLKVMKT